MKKAILMSGLAVLLMASCKKNEAPVPPPPPPVEDPAPPVKPEPEVPVAPVATPPPAPAEPKDGTSVSVDANGVSVQSKNGDKSNNVIISKNKKAVQIQTQH